MFEQNENTTRTSRNKFLKKRKKRRRRFVFWGIFLLFLAGIAIYGTRLLSAIQSAINKTTQIVKTDNIRESSRQATDPFSVLLVGIDKGGEYGYTNEPSRTDTMIVATIDPKTNETTLASIPRDTLVPLKVDKDNAAYGKVDKINHAFAYGGIEAAINTVQNYLQVPIDDYIQIDIDGLIKLVDALGGVTLTSPITFEQEGYSFVEGKSVTLDGMGANIFARMRYLDPNGTAGRELRQRLLISAMMKKLLSPDTLLNYQNILNVVSDNVRMSFTFNRLLELKDLYTNAFSNMKQEHFKTIPIDIDNGYYDLILDKEHLRVSNILRQHLKLDPITSDTLLEHKVSTTTLGFRNFLLYNSSGEYIDNKGISLSTGLPYQSEDNN